MRSLRISLFGRPHVRGARLDQPLATERLAQLAVLLAARRDWISRDHVIGLLWPELDEASARRNLRKLLFRARGEPWFDGLETSGDSLRWPVESDAADFERACAAGDAAAAIASYARPFCEPFDAKATAAFGEWLQFERNRLAGLFRTAVRQRLSQLADDYPGRERVARHWLEADLVDEGALETLVHALRAQGRDAEAKQAVDDFAVRLDRDIGVAPTARVLALASAATARAPVAAGSPLARADADLVGRRTELRQIDALLARDECRIVTVCGPGGIGKSRLARAAVAAAAGRFEPICWVEMSDLADASLVVARLADTLGLAPGDAADALQPVSQTLRGRRALLVFDNSEHLVELPALIERLVLACPEAKVLLTSRARLALPAEWLVPLQGLTAPDADETEPDVVRTFDAVRLFERRAAAALPAFDPARNALDVAALVRALEGAPLAIELAAAWVRMLPVADIRREIERSLDLLEGVQHAADRHRSVRACFDHSWRLMTALEQRCLTQLTVFAAPFAREAAAQVAHASLPVLAALVDKSLLRADGDGRFSFHPLMRECAAEKPGGHTAARARHAHYFARTLANPDLSWAGQRAELERIEAHYEDYLRAWRWALQERQPWPLEALALPLMRMFVVRGRGRMAEGIALLEDAMVALAPAGMTGAVLAHALGTLLYRFGDLGRAGGFLARAVDEYRRLRAPPALARPCLVMLALNAYMTGDLQVAQRHFEDVVRMARQERDPAAAAYATNGLGLCVRALGDAARALRLHEEAERLHEQANNVLGMATALHDAGTALQYLKRFDESTAALRRALALCDAHDFPAVRIYVLVSLGNTSFERGWLGDAWTWLKQALDGERASGETHATVHLRLGLARVATRRGALGEARGWLLDAVGRVRAQPSRSVPSVLYAAAEWFAARGDTHRAAMLWRVVADSPLAEAIDGNEARRELDRLPPAAVKAAAVAPDGAVQFDALLDEVTHELKSPAPAAAAG
jgi:predicted ATPase